MSPYREVYFLYHSTVALRPSSQLISSVQPRLWSLLLLMVVTEIVEFPVGNIGDEFVLFLFSTHELDERSGDIDVGDFVDAANVVDLSGASPVEDDIKGPCDVFYVEEVAGIGSVSVDGNGPVAEELVGELGDELLGELVGSVHVVAARDEAGEFERPKVGLDQKLGAGLGGSVRGWWVPEHAPPTWGPSQRSRPHRTPRRWRRG